LLCVVDELTREALAIRVGRKLSSSHVIDTLAELFLARGAPSKRAPSTALRRVELIG
jgi:hypothetical protein